MPGLFQGEKPACTRLAYTECMSEESAARTWEDAASLQAVMVHRDRFLRFLLPRVEDEATAEDILHGAYVKALEHGAQIRDQESAVAWFYRTLRNAVIDHYRRRAARGKALATFAAGMPETYEPELPNRICACLGDVVQGLKPEYRSALESVDLLGLSVDEFASTEAISSNNAAVRLHRARRAAAAHLRTVCGACAEHRCLDCTCRRSKV
jgi:RNA polymerase sigma-70 factor, ECF subfamily